MFDFGIYLLTLAFLPQVVQKCQLGMGRLEEAKTKAAEWAVDKEELQKASEARNELPAKEARKNADLAANLEKAKAEMERL